MSFTISKENRMLYMGGGRVTHQAPVVDDTVDIFTKDGKSYRITANQATAHVRSNDAKDLVFDNSTRDDFEGLNLFTPKNVLYYTDPVTKRMELYKVDATEDEVWDAGPQYTCMLRFPKAYIYREAQAYALSDTKIDSNYTTEPAFVNYRDNTEYRYIEISKFYYNKSTYSCPNTVDYNNILSSYQGDIAYESKYDEIFPELPSNSGELNLSLNSYVCDQYYKKLIAIKFLYPSYYVHNMSYYIQSYNRSSNEFSPEVFLHSYWLMNPYMSRWKWALLMPTPNLLFTKLGATSMEYYFNLYNERAVIGGEGTTAKLTAAGKGPTLFIGIMTINLLNSKGLPTSIFIPGGTTNTSGPTAANAMSWGRYYTPERTPVLDPLYMSIEPYFSDNHNALLIEDNIAYWKDTGLPGAYKFGFKLYRQVK